MNQALPNLLILFTCLPLLGAALCMAIGRRPIRQRLHSQNLIAAITSVVNTGMAAYVLYLTSQSGSMVLHVGNRIGPLGITLVADVFASLLLLVTGLIFLAVVPYAIDLMDGRDRLGFHPLLLFLLMGVNGAFLAGDLFNLFVFFEVLVISSFVLLTLGGQTSQIRGGLRFVVLNLLASFVFLAAIAVAYGVFGTLNLAHLASLAGQAGVPDWALPIIGGLLFVAFGNKAALFPLHFWLPSSYYTTHPAVNAVFGGLLTKVGIYALLRVFTLLLPSLLEEWHVLFLTVAGMTITVGTVGAFSQRTMRRILSFKIIGHVGFIFLGLGMVGAGALPAAVCLAATIAYLLHHMLVKTALLLAAGLVEIEFQTGRVYLRDLKRGGLLARRPWLAVWFMLAALSLLGIPPFSGFIGKVGILQLLVEDRQWALLAVVTVTSVLSLMMIMRIWQSFFWGPPDAEGVDTEDKPVSGFSAHFPVAGLVACSLFLGVFGQQLWNVSLKAAEQLQDRDTYIQRVALSTEIEAPHH